MNVNEESESKGNFDGVISYIKNTIIKETKVVSMKVLQSIYDGTNGEDKRYRHKLKLRIQKEFPNFLQFVQPSATCAEVVFSKSIFDETLVPLFERNTNIESVAKQ